MNLWPSRNSRVVQLVYCDRRRIVDIALLLFFIAQTRLGATLVLLLPTQSGIVTCTDRKQWNAAEGAADAQKLFRLDRHAAFVVVGAAELSVYVRSKLKPVYSLAQSVETCYARQIFTDKPQYWKQLGRCVKGRFETAYKVHGTRIEQSPGATDDVVWEIDFVYLANRTPAIEQIAYHLTGEVSSDPLPQKPYITGQTAVALRILRPKLYPDPRFSDLLGNPQIARVWNGFAPNYPSAVTVTDALAFAHIFIRASSERMPFVDNGPDLVGTICDCMVMRKDSGFSWLERELDTRTIPIPVSH